MRFWNPLAEDLVLAEVPLDCKGVQSAQDDRFSVDC